jgi:hypothetical protein
MFWVARAVFSQKMTNSASLNGAGVCRSDQYEEIAPCKPIKENLLER